MTLMTTTTTTAISTRPPAIAKTLASPWTRRPIELSSIALLPGRNVVPGLDYRVVGVWMLQLRSSSEQADPS